MKVVIVTVVAVILAVGVTEGKPSPRELTRLLRTLHRRAGGDCEKLAADIEKLVNFMVVTAPLPPGMLRGLIQRVSGIDLLDPSEMRRVVCRVTEASTLSEAKAAAAELGLTLSVVTAGYDMGMAYVPQAVAMLESQADNPWLPENQRSILESSLEMLRVIQESSLGNLDPEGVQWMADFIESVEGRQGPKKRSNKHTAGFLRSLGLLPLRVTSKKSRSSHGKRYEGKHKRTHNELCDRFSIGLDTMLNLLWASPVGDQIARQVMMSSGISLNDSEQVRNIACDILGLESIQAGIDYLDNLGVINRLVTTYYPTFVQAMLMVKTEYQAMVEIGENGAGSSSAGSAGLAHARLVVATIEGLEQTGFLSLTNDLS